MKCRYVIGIDEVGRGSLAGPVTVAAVVAPANSKFKILSFNLKLRDSKKLTQKQRRAWMEYIKNHPRISYAVARVYPRTVERINISKAANLAALRSYERLTKSCNLQPKTSKVYLDGGLFLGNSEQPKNAKTVTRGDQKFASVKLASIVAKVHRDRYMVQLAKKYPEYGFEIHKGYGTKAHTAAIKKHGPSEVHRLTFVGKIK